MLAIEREGAAIEAQPIDVFFAADGIDRGQLLAIMSELRRRRRGLRLRLRRPVAEGPAHAVGAHRRLDARDRGRRRGEDPAAGTAGHGGGARGPHRYAQRMSRWRDQRGSSLRAEDVGRTVAVAGWVATRRDHGGLVFVDVRDEDGVVQVVVNPEHAPAAAEVAHQLRNEFVVRARGPVVRRAPRPSTRRWRPARSRSRPRSSRSSRARRRSPSSSTRRASTRRSASAIAGSTCAAPRCSATSAPARSSSRSSAPRWRRTASSTSRRRSWASPPRRARATSSCPRACSPAASSRCRRARRSTSSSS